MPNFFQRWLASLILIPALACAASLPSFAHDRDGEVRTAAARVKHVFVIVLENKTFSNTFGASTQDPYLQKTLVPMGGLLTQYYGTGHVSLDNYISMISGQSPTSDTGYAADDPAADYFLDTFGNDQNVFKTDY